MTQEHLNTTNTDLLLIFTRNPELGKCKTRLAATIGDTEALKIYQFLLNHTVNITKNLELEKYVYYSEAIWEDDIWSVPAFKKKLQQGKDLGARMSKAFDDGFDSGFQKIMVIGSDMFDLSESDIESAFTSLETSDYVIGPAEDGGYYLLGMKKKTPRLFENKEWGQETVLSATLKDLENERHKLLEIKNDIDLYDDIKDIEVFQPFLKHIVPND